MSSIWKKHEEYCRQNSSNRSNSKSRRNYTKYQPKKSKSKQKSMHFSSISQMQESRLNSHIRDQENLRQSKPQITSRKHIQFSQSQLKLSNLPNAQKTQSVLISSNRKHNPLEQELKKLKKDFKNFQQMVKCELQRQEKMIEDFISEIRKSMAFQTPKTPLSSSSANLNLKQISFEESQKKVFQSPIRLLKDGKYEKALEGTKAKTPRKHFDKFFQTIGKLRLEVESFSQIGFLRQRAGERLKHVKSAKLLKKIQL